MSGRRAATRPKISSPEIRSRIRIPVRTEERVCTTPVMLNNIVILSEAKNLLFVNRLRP